MDINGLVVVVKKGGRFFTGGIKNSKFVRYREVKKLADLKHRDSYVTLAKYLKDADVKGNPASILSSLKVDRMYVRMTPVVKTPQEIILPGTPVADEKLYWADYYHLCKTCAKSCKQSHMILSLICPSYNKK
jgi:hypothetical protein